MGKRKNKRNNQGGGQWQAENKTNSNNEGGQKEDGENNNNSNNEGGQKEEGDNKKNGNNITVVLKTDLHCDGCASKVVKCIRSFDGVDKVTIGDGQKITVVGKVDPAKLRERVQQKTHKKVELISPQPKKDGGGDSNGKSDQKNPKEKVLPVTKAVYKVALHCDGCIQRIYKTIVKAKGYADMSVDKEKDLVTVSGAIDVKALAEVLSKKMKRRVEIVNDAKKAGDGEKKEDGGGGGGNNNNKMQAHPSPNPFTWGPVFVGDQIHYNPIHYPAPQFFSDENPNSCSVM